jgi:hypothetical protein
MPRRTTTTPAETAAALLPVSVGVRRLTGADRLTLPLGFAPGTVTLVAGEALPEGVPLPDELDHLFTVAAEATD